MVAEQHVPDQLLGTLVAKRFLLDEKLGEGSSWLVYIARDMASGKKVVVKVLREEVAAEPDACSRFLKQAEDGFKLNHANIVHSLATGSENGRQFLITEYVQGRNIRQWFADEGRDFNKLRGKLKVVCDALHYAHSNGVFHRSLKPENVLVDENDAIKLVDFGFARRLEGQTRETASASSNVAYLTPEQAKGQRGDARSDLYSLGVLIYELATGKVPFWAPDPVRIVFMHINETPVRPRHINPKVPMWIEHIVMRLLQKDPGQRHQSVREVHDELARSERRNEAEFIELEATDFAQARRSVGCAPLVGREESEQLLRELLGAAAVGHGSTVLVHGPIGVGKSRLLADIATYANLMGFATLRGAGTAQAHSPFLPFVAVVREYLRRNDLRVRDIVVDESGLLDYFLEGRLDPVLAPDASGMLLRYQELILDFIAKIARLQPVMLVLEGVEHFDQASLRLVDRIADTVGSSHLLLALTWREGEPMEGRTAWRLIQRIHAMAPTRQIVLQPLDASRIQALTWSLVGAERASDRLLAAIEAASDGVPLHLEEMLTLLMRDRVLEVVEGTLRCVGPADEESRVIDRIMSARGVRHLFEQRVAVLPEKVSMVLTLAACIGSTFDFEVLMKVSGKPQEEVTSVLQWALRNHLIEEKWTPSRETFRFRHSMLRDALYAALDPRSRKRLHLLIGGAMEEAFGARLRDIYESLAHQFECSDQFEKAVDYASLAAERFQSFGEDELEACYLARALDLSEAVVTVTVERRVHWIKRLAHLCRTIGDEAAGQMYEERARSLSGERRAEVSTQEPTASST